MAVLLNRKGWYEADVQGKVHYLKCNVIAIVRVSAHTCNQDGFLVEDENTGLVFTTDFTKVRFQRP